MNTKDIPENLEPAPLLGLGSSEGLGAGSEALHNWHSHEGVFVGRTAEGAARQLAVVLASAAEWNLATLERMKMRKATTKYDLQRQTEICDKLVAQCVDLRIGASGLRGHLCGRLIERMRAASA